MLEMVRKKESHWWLFEGHKNTKRSPWLQSTIEELDEKTKAILRLIDEDADSFAQRAEMLFKKRPELISMVEDFYRAHRSLAERYDLARAEPVTRPSPPLESPTAASKPKPEKLPSLVDQSYDMYSISSISEDYNDSEIDDPEHEANATEAEKEPEHTSVSSMMESGELEHLTGDESDKIEGEDEKLKECIRIHETQLQQKDEEKREVIRQLSVAIEMLKEENADLRQIVTSYAQGGCNPKPTKPPAFNKFKEFFSGNLFNFPKPKSTDLSHP